jgi:pSer/pThr/pTyr-binding forkhead associated (FHA) protein
MSAVTHLLKVLNGPHTGAQSGFGNGEDLLIGNSAEADIILSDPHILPQHCRIKLSGNECVVIPLDGEVFVSGRSVVAPEPIDAGRVVTIGSTSFVVGAKDALWPPLVIPDLKNIGRLSDQNGSEVSANAPTDSDSGTSPLRILLICLAVLSVIIFAASVITAKSSRKPAAP